MSDSELEKLFDRIRTISDSVHSIDKRLSRIEDLFLLANDDKKDHEKRIRMLEKWAWGIPPALLMAVLALLERIVG